MAETKAIVLDFNGTLAQDDHLVAPLYIEAFASLGLRLTAEEYHRELSALPDEIVFDLALQRAGRAGDVALRESLISRRVDGYLAAVAGRPPIDSAAAAFVRTASSRMPLAIVSGAFKREIESVLAAAGLRERFTTVVAIEDVTYGKPHPEGFLRAVQRLNDHSGGPIAAIEAVAIEDSTGGARAARAAGMRVAALRGPGYDPASGLADVVINRLDPKALNAIMGFRR
jgi:HAD superfamily hydrolase (TIGR01509 family)